MKFSKIAPEAFRWEELPETRTAGEQGFVLSRTRESGEVRVRKVIYSPGYKADHWCEKGHVVFVLDGGMKLLHRDGTSVMVSSGMTYLVGDEAMAHSVESPGGATVLIAD